jgi:nucleoside triphosphate diphosphatase
VEKRRKSARRRIGKAAKQKRRPGKLFEDLVALQARLLAPGGCPWDREQTHDTLRPYLIEETYEVLDALDSGDANHLAEELGDLLLQVVFHAQLGAQAGLFDISDVIEHIHTKMVRRHPHVFGKVKADTAAQVLKKWEELKAEERAEKKKQNEDGPASVLDGVPRTLPALMEAHQLSRRASNVGFDWRRPIDILGKLSEETAEMRRELESQAAADSGGRDTPQRARQEDELGDLLFVCVNLARFLKLDAEIALKKANAKFARRFRQMERTAAGRGQQLSMLSPAELETLWSEAKKGERGPAA